MIKEFGVTNLEVTKEDISKNPNNPILRMYDDEELIGTFSILNMHYFGIHSIMPEVHLHFLKHTVLLSSYLLILIFHLEVHHLKTLIQLLHHEYKYEYEPSDLYGYVHSDEFQYHTSKKNT